MSKPLERADAESLDASDPLAPLRGEVLLPDTVVYLDGNSLGALPRRTVERVHQLITQEWGQGLVRSWNAHGCAAMVPMELTPPATELPRAVGD